MLSVKIKQQDLLPDSKSISDSIPYLGLLRTTECLIFPSAFQLARIGYIIARARRINCF